MLIIQTSQAYFVIPRSTFALISLDQHTGFHSQASTILLKKPFLKITQQASEKCIFNLINLCLALQVFYTTLFDIFLDVIGFVADVKEVKNLKTKTGNDIKKVNVMIQDLKFVFFSLPFFNFHLKLTVFQQLIIFFHYLSMETICLTLWNSYADRIIEFWENREEHGVIVLILQFGWLKYYLKSSYVNNAFDVSKLFLNSDNDETTTFKNRCV